ncbi:MAG: hypothetical protein J6K32_05625 [Clostridia bacterium]|nr:hypothetical protein [Clostridia bacterium]
MSGHMDVRRLLLVLCASPGDAPDCHALLRRMRRAARAAPVLLLCDLPDAPTQKAAGDHAITRLLQSGVMSMARHEPQRYLLLVRSRVYDSAQHRWLGVSQPESPGVTAARLITGGHTGTKFEAATFTPASLRDQADYVLLLRGAVCTPDVPMQLMHAAEGMPCACARIILPHRDSEPLLCRLVRSGFSLSAMESARADALLGSGQADPRTSPALMLGPEGLRMMSRDALPGVCPIVQDCPAVLTGVPAPADLFESRRCVCAHAFSPQCAGHRARLDALLPLVQLLLLMLSAWLGGAPLAGAVLLLPEYAALLQPRLLPGALVRLCLLPAHAAVSLDALLQRLTARSRLLRIELPRPAPYGGICAFCGMLLLAAAVHGGGALAALTTVSLLFAASPWLLPALASPVSERIPLNTEEKAQLLAMAKSAYLAHSAQPSPACGPALLAACAGCMLGLLEPDEAARQAQTLMDQVHQEAPVSAADAACALTAAQYLRERMGDCDASLRPLPARIERLFTGKPVSGSGALPALMRRICPIADDDHTPAIPAAGRNEPLDALFLPPWLCPPCESAHDPRAPLLCPHTFLQTRADAPAVCDTDAMLLLAEAALGQPFHALFLRSPAAGPYAPALAEHTAGQRTSGKKKKG